VALALAAAVLVSALFYSSFLSNPKGVVDSLRTLAAYLARADGDGRHVHTWHYYLDLLTWLSPWARPRWNEDFTVLMAAVGLAYVVTRRPMRTCDPCLARFLAVYTLAMAVVYSAIPYKTPWCMMGALHGMILVSAIAVAELTQSVRSRRARALCVTGILGLGVVSPLGQAYLLNSRYDSVPSNPYVYAHTSRDIFSVVERVRQMAAVHPRGKAMVVQVVCPEADYWPLPWYLRDFTAVGYYQAVDFNAPAGDVILAKPDVEPDLVRLFYEVPLPGSRRLYVPLLDPGTRLRPGVAMRGYVRKDLWDRLASPGDANDGR
jgi:predicted membrane-bound mannosyltransferase